MCFIFFASSLQSRSLSPHILDCWCLGVAVRCITATFPNEIHIHTIVTHTLRVIPLHFFFFLDFSRIRIRWQNIWKFMANDFVMWCKSISICIRNLMNREMFHWKFQGNAKTIWSRTIGKTYIRTHRHIRFFFVFFLLSSSANEFAFNFDGIQGRQRRGESKRIHAYVAWTKRSTHTGKCHDKIILYTKRENGRDRETISYTLAKKVRMREKEREKKPALHLRPKWMFHFTINIYSVRGFGAFSAHSTTYKYKYMQ